MKMISRKMNCSLVQELGMSVLPSRTKFSHDEDERLRELVEKYGTNDWSKISLLLGGRTSRQCRERYKNFLQPSLVNGPWTAEEDEMLIRLFHQYGPSWVTIRQAHFPTRSNNNIKNHWAILAAQIMKMTTSLRRHSHIGCKNDDSEPVRRSFPTPIFNSSRITGSEKERYSIKALLW
jgi:hypothetical protein